MKRLIREAAVTASDAQGRGLGLCITSQSPKMYILYDAGAVYEEISSSPDSSVADLGAYMMGVVTLKQKRKGRQWNASEIELTAAEQGYGPLVYDVAMAFEGGLVPDRERVSGSAAGVWDFYRARRPDVKTKPLDDEGHPHTRPKIDDTETMHDPDGDSSLDYAYFIDKAPNVAGLVKNHRLVLKAARGGLDEDEFAWAAADYSEEKYAG